MAGSISRFLRQKLVHLIHSVSICLRLFFSFIASCIFRLRGDCGSSFNQNGEKVNSLEAEPEILPEDKAENDMTEFRNFDDDGDEEEKPEVYLKFKFPTYEEFTQSQKATGNNLLNPDVVPSASGSKYDSFLSRRSFISGFVEDVETLSVKEIDDTNGRGDSLEEGRGFSDKNSEKGQDILVSDGEANEKREAKECTEESEEKAQRVEEEDGLQANDEFLDESVGNDSDWESTSHEHMPSAMKRSVDYSYSDGFSSDGFWGGESDIDSENEKMETGRELSSGFHENQNFPEYYDDEESDLMAELKKLEEEHNPQHAGGPDSDFLCEEDFEDLDDVTDAEFSTTADKATNEGDHSEKTESEDSSTFDSEDANGLESLWEHQELVEQLQMELRKVRATGLPTILEDSESPKIMDDLKPWKIDEFQREDCMGELHKFYKSYRERMRKLDIINYQKMYAMGFLQLRDPLQFMSKQKTSAPTLKSLLSQNLPLFRNKIHGSDPMKKFMEELKGDLEVVYVGHMCLSWEFLHWQYEKALDLWDSDPRGVRRYNEVAGEFQQFQVLLQRFIEDEPFQGPRMQNYVKTRCLTRNLLQVPVIREDSSKDKRKGWKKDTDDYAITSDMVVEIVEESIRIFWRFVRADRDCNSSAMSSNKKIMPELPYPEDHELLVETKKILQKKERKLRDLLKSENCVLRKFRRRREDDDSDPALYFFAQVDMKLVCRVLNMSKITRDQLIWCHNKLSRISLVGRKIYVEPALLLFPS